MKKIGLLIVFGLILTPKTEAGKLAGKLLLKHDTMDVTFNIPVNFVTQKINYEKLQYRIKYVDSTGKKVVIRPEQAEEIRFNYEEEEVRMLSRYCSPGLNHEFSRKRKVFLKLEIDGILKMFKYYFTENSPAVYNGSENITTGGYSIPATRYVLQKSGEEIFIPGELTFRKNMVEYFQDCPALSLKIENKEYRKKDLEIIISYYNANCAK